MTEQTPVAKGPQDQQVVRIFDVPRSLTDGPYTVSGYAEQGWNGSFDKLDELVRST
jgi:hypothetical protein